MRLLQYSPSLLPPFFIALLMLAFQSEKPPVSPRKITIRAISGLQYDSVRFQVKPGQKVQLTLVNTDEMAHNLALVLPDERGSVVEAALQMGSSGEAKSFIPASEAVLAAIPVLKPDEQYTITFTAPEKEGIYPYVCTYPGHGAVMYGAMYVTANQLPPLANDPNVPVKRRGANAGHQHGPQASGHPYPSRLPAVYRTFLPDTGPASIAVGLPGGVSYCWDAGQCRLRYAWKGGFVNMERAWSGKGKERADIIGVKFYTETGGVPLRPGQADAQPVARFKGYSLVNRFPVFNYTLNGLEVTERIMPVTGQPGLHRIFSVKDAPGPVYFIAQQDENVIYESNRGEWQNGCLKLTAAQASDFTITITKKNSEN